MSREIALPPAPGMNSSVTFAPCAPALKTLSSVRQAVPPTPFVCVVTETSERCGVFAATETCFEIVPELPPFDAVRLTVYVPADAKVMAGFREVDVRPSPNDHDHCVGPPVERSVKLTLEPTVGVDGENSKSAVTGGVTGAGLLTVIVFVAVDDSELRKTVSVTV